LLQIGKCGYPWSFGAARITTSTTAKRFHDPCAATVEAKVVAVGIGVARTKSLPGHIVDLCGFESVAYGGELCFETVKGRVSTKIAGTQSFDITYR